MGWAKFWFIVATCKQVGEKTGKAVSNSIADKTELHRIQHVHLWRTKGMVFQPADIPTGMNEKQKMRETKHIKTCYFKKWKKEKAPYPPIHLSPHTSRAASNDVPIQEGGDLGPILKCLSGSPYII